MKTNNRKEKEQWPKKNSLVCHIIEKKGLKFKEERNLVEIEIEYDNQYENMMRNIGFKNHNMKYKETK